MPTEKRHNAPCSNRDYDFFYEGLEDRKILAQKCADCGKLRAPPEPMCPHCHSLKWTGAELTGKGTLYSYTIHYYPPLPGFDTPHPVALVALDEGVRIVGALDGVPLDEIKIGMPVAADFYRQGEMASFRFRRA